jgi:hypothetical protein
LRFLISGIAVLADQLLRVFPNRPFHLSFPTNQLKGMLGSAVIFGSPELMKCRSGQRVPANGPNDRVNLARVKYPTLTQVDHEAAAIRTPRRQVQKSLKLREPFYPVPAFVLILCRKVIRVVPDLIPRSCEHLSFDCLASPPHYAGHRSLMDSSLDVTIAKKQIGRMSKPLSAIHHVADVVLGSRRR